ncbi:MAG: chorismate-binding protein [Bacteroidales bacterium]|nr:chorismate-binding protein [Bacteroidales bacterium]
MLVKLFNLCLQKNIPFVSYRLPDETAINTWVQLSGKFNFYENIHEIIDRTGFVYAPFHRKTNFPIVFFEPELILNNENFDDAIFEKIANQEPIYPEYHIEEPFEISKADYLKQAAFYIKSFDENFRKAILSRVHIEKNPEHFNAGKYFMDLQNTYPNAFCHLINIPGAGTWAGATPETLVRIQNNTAQTISLAGTQAYSGKDQIVNWQEKELEEQQIVTDYIEGVFQKFGIKNYKKKKLQNLIAGNAIHLATKFSFDKSFVENQLGKFISHLHPTPAVCGLPKEKALELIIQTEKHNREYYAGFLGTINMNHRTDLFINLRCMKILKNKIALFVGGGLIKQSEPEKEWEETILKSQTLLKIFQ